MAGIGWLLRFVVGPTVGAIVGRAALLALNTRGHYPEIWLASIFVTTPSPQIIELVTWIVAAIIGVGLYGIAYYFLFARAPRKAKSDVPPAGAFHFPNYRRLNEEQKASLADALRNSGATIEHINVIYSTLESECANFAEDLADALTMAGMESEPHESAHQENVRERGLKIFVGKSDSSKTVGNAIFDSLKSLGFHAERREISNDRDTYLYVYRRSEGAE